MIGTTYETARKIAGITMFILVILLVLSMFIIIGDNLTIEKVGTKSVPCVDKYDRPFENEMCTKKITCSKLGLVGNKKCSEVGR